MSSLPAPSADALDHSQRLCEVITTEISHEGWISFARYMELALYTPGLGYYSAGAQKFGTTGDFVTAPEISSLFGRTLAHQVVELLPQAGNNVLEIGAGSGKLVVDILSALNQLNSLPAHYYILEVSADLQARQQKRVQEEMPQLASRVSWLDTLPQEFEGVIIGNEVLDAMPVHMLKWQRNNLFERGVGYDTDRGFFWCDIPLGQGTLFEVASGLNPGGEMYVSEINLAARGFIAALAGMMKRGMIFLIDYGFAEREYYHPQRHSGTLMCHYRHHAHSDPFYLPGLQDITAHVDFSAIAHAATANGLNVSGYANQAQFLVNCGITEVLAETPADDVTAYLPRVAEVQKLLSPAEMGELFKVIALEKNCSLEPLGFKSGNKMNSL